MTTTYVPVLGAMALLPNLAQNSQKTPINPAPATRAYIPPAPMPQTLFGTTAVTSSSS
jgi:hypothetical protein